MNIKKITKFFSFLFVLISGIFVSTSNVHAVATKGDIISGKYVSGPYYVIHEKSNGSHMWLQAQFINRTSDGQFVYCVQPYFTIKEDNTYNITTEDFAAVLNMSQESWEQISRLAYYGYGYKDNNYDHTSDKWYIATQMLIWNIADPSIDSYFTNTLKGTRNDNILKAEMDELLYLANNHKVLPNLTNFPNEMVLGQTVTLSDSNSVLQNYDITNVNNATITKNGNALNITANNVGNISFNITRYGNRYDNPIQLYYATDSQNVMHRGNLDPISISKNIKVIGGKVELHKVDSVTNSSQVQGEGLISNAKYGIYDNNGNLIQTLITDSNGYAISDYLPSIGTLYIQEISPSIGYKLDSEKHYFEINSNNLLVSITSKEEIIKNRIKVYKVDSENNTCTAQGQGTLSGAKYGVYDWNNQLVDTLTIGSDCTATSKELPYGKYYVKELQSSTGYYKDENTYNVNINNEVMLKVTSKENVIKSNIKIKKVDSENNTCTAQGQATLSGAKYGVYDWNKKLVDTIIIKNDCTGTSINLPYGNYTVKEIEASTGYQLDTNTYEANINSNSAINITSKEKVYKNYISILKQYDYVDGNSTFLNAESGITFDIYYPNGNKYGSVTTDKNGYAEFEIAYGTWKLHQVNTNTGFEKIYDFYITVDKDSKKEQYYNILNNAISAYIKIIKVDSEIGKVIKLKNTSFKILDESTNQYVSQFVGGKVISTFYTDEEGIAYTPLKLKSGNYKVVEVSSPQGYLIRPEGYSFTIGDNTHFNYTTYGAFVTIEYANTSIKGQIEINKLGQTFNVDDGSFYYDFKELDNIVFEVYADEDILSSDKNHLYYSKGDLVDTLTTDKNGYAISKKLPLGKYLVKEAKTKDAYVLDKTEYIIELTEIDNVTPIIFESLTAVNYLKKGDLIFSKVDLTDGKVIPNTKVQIYTEDNKLIFEGITDEEGNIRIDNLFIGKYYIVETEAATGYKLSDEKVYFEIKNNGEIVKAKMTNEKITGTLEFTKKDFSTDEPLPNTVIEIYTDKDKLIFSGKTAEDGKIIIEKLEYGKYYILEKEAPEGYVLNKEKMYFEIKEDGEVIKSEMKNKQIESIIIIHKVDENENPLEGVLIGIYDLDDNLIYSDKTDSEGNIKYALKYGSYYFQEIEGLDGYEKNDEKVYFDITEDGEFIQHTLVNIQEIVEVPNTEEDDYLVIICTILIISATGVVIYNEIKKKKNK